jgi:parvulin-like peptidyl-prolyl isomerase
VWSGPVRSAFGEHLVELLDLEPGVPPPFEAVRHAVLEDWRRGEAEELREAQYKVLRERYEVILPTRPAP